MMREAIEQDLLRFLPAEVLSVHRAKKYNALLDSVCSIFSEIKAKGVRLP